MIQRIMAMAMAGTPLTGSTGSHFQARAAVLEQRGSMTAIFMRPSTVPSVTF